MKIFITTIIWAGMVIVGLAQDSPKADPFKKKKTASVKHTATFPQVVTSFEFIDVDTVDQANWKSESLSDDELRAEVEKQIVAEKASVVESAVLMSLSGRRARARSSRHVINPLEWKALEFDPEGPLFPMSQDQYSECGFVVEIDPILMADGGLTLSYSLTRRNYTGEDRSLYPNNERVLATDLLYPKFVSQKLTSQVNVTVGEYVFLGTQNSLSENADRKTMIFLRTDVANVYANKESVTNPGNVRLRCEWIELSASDWHRYTYQNRLNEIPLGAWEWVAGLLKKGDAKSVCDHTMMVPSGQRTLKQTFKESAAISHFKPPTSLGGVCEPLETKLKTEIGFKTEVDPLLAAVGVVELNFVTQKRSRGDDFVSYRRKVGDKWLPAVISPNIHEASTVTTVVLPETGTMLVGALTPSLEDGSQDRSKKYLQFWHNETFKK